MTDCNPGTMTFSRLGPKAVVAGGLYFFYQKPAAPKLETAVVDVGDVVSRAGGAIRLKRVMARL